MKLSRQTDVVEHHARKCRARLGGASVPWYVVGKDSRGGSNSVYVAPGADHPALFTTSAAIIRCFWVSGARPRGMDTDRGAKLSAQTRYGARAVSCTARTMDARSKTSMLVPSVFCTPPDLDEVLGRANADGAAGAGARTAYFHSHSRTQTGPQNLGTPYSAYLLLSSQRIMRQPQ